jgi:hypothetical protein
VDIRDVVVVVGSLRPSSSSNNNNNSNINNNNSNINSNSNDSRSHSRALLCPTLVADHLLLLHPPPAMDPTSPLPGLLRLLLLLPDLAVLVGAQQLRAPQLPLPLLNPRSRLTRFLVIPVQLRDGPLGSPSLGSSTMAFGLSPPTHIS